MLQVILLHRLKHLSATRLCISERDLYESIKSSGKVKQLLSKSTNMRISHMTEEKLVKRLNSLRNSKNESRVKNLHTLLYDEYIWIMAYQNIYSNKGAFTKGSDESDTLENFNKERINKIIASLKDMSYQCKPAKRINIPKSNGKLRPLSIPCGTDKLVQEACRIILESIYEPKFSDSSHGFRPGRSCHTALHEVSKWSGTKWWIEFDIKGCFDNIDHNILINILKNKIEDDKFLGLIRKFLNAGYFDNFQYHNTFSGTPQGGIVSPILANIYLNELDKYIDKYCNEINNKVDSRDKNKEYYDLSNIINHGKEKLENYKEKIKNIQSYIDDNIDWNSLSDDVKKLYMDGFEARKKEDHRKVYSIAIMISRRLKLNKIDINQTLNYKLYNNIILHLEKEIEEAKNKRETLRTYNTTNEFERLHYVRYADDFVLGYIGSKLNAERIFKDIENFIKSNLALSISEEKSKIIFGSKGVIFLSYWIHMPDKTDSKIKYTTQYGNTILRKRNTVKPVFKVPVEKAINFVSKRGYGSYVENISIHRSFLQNFDEIEIIKQYNAELRGLIQYYKHAVNCKKVIGKVQWLWQYSLLKTIAAKHKTTVAQIFKKKIIKIKTNIQTKQKIWYYATENTDHEIFNIRDIEYESMFSAGLKFENISDVEFKYQFNIRSSALLKLMADKCELCDVSNTETNIILHHPNKIKNIPKDLDLWDRIKRMRSRKTIALCHKCHMKIHH